MKHIQSAISVLLALVMLLGLCACTSDTPETEGSAIDASGTLEPTETPQPLSETTLAEMEIFDAIDYSNDHFLTEAEFYSILQEVLALHDLTMTPGGPEVGGYFYFNYNNLDGVRLLTVAKTMDDIRADQDEAWAEHEKAAEEYARKQEAAANGASYEEPEEDTEGEEEEDAEEIESIDLTKDVLHSDDYVTSFVLSAGQSETDQQVMFLVSAAVWCIMNPRYNNTDDAFAYLWRALYTTYAHSEGLAASTIDGFDSDMPFTIPGNAAEAWMSTDDNGNYILAITPYAVYDEIIDIAGTTGSSFQQAAMPSSILG